MLKPHVTFHRSRLDGKPCSSQNGVWSYLSMHPSDDDVPETSLFRVNALIRHLELGEAGISQDGDESPKTAKAPRDAQEPSKESDLLLNDMTVTVPQAPNPEG